MKNMIVVTVVALCLAAGAESRADAIKLYWGEQASSQIRRADMDGTSAETLVNEGGYGLAIDSAGGKMFWGNWADDLKRADLDGSDVENLIDDVYRADDIELDLAGGKMYFSAESWGTVRRANLDGSEQEDLVTANGPSGIALDLAAGKLYFATYGDDRIRRCNLDGSDVEELVTSGLTYVRHLELDVAAGKMYWTDWTLSNPNRVCRANLDGSGVQVLYSSGQPWGLELDLQAGKLYIADYYDNRITRMNLDGSGVEHVVTGATQALSVALEFDEPPVPEPAGLGLIGLMMLGTRRKRGL